MLPSLGSGNCFIRQFIKEAVEYTITAVLFYSYFLLLLLLLLVRKV